MKSTKLFSVCVFVFLWAGSLWAGSSGWHVNVEEAKALAKKEDKPVLVVFTGSDWCPPCMRLHKEVFVEPAFADFAKDALVLVELDFPNKKKLSEEQVKHNEEMAKQYDIRGFPTVLLMDAEGKVFAQTGYQSGGVEKYIAHLQDLLQKG